MSTWRDETIDCPGCDTHFVVQLATSLHITRLPAIKRRILDGELHRFPCPSCGRTVEVQQPVLYTDFARGDWFEMRPEAQLAEWCTLAPACQAQFERAIEHGSPIVREHTPQFQVRLVFGYRELREKVLLRDAGLDDVLVECLKLDLVRRDPSILGPTDRLLVREVDARGAVVIDTRRGAIEAWPGPHLAEIRDVLGTPFPDPFVSISRLVGRYAITAS